MKCRKIINDFYNCISLSTINRRALSGCGYKGWFPTQVSWLISTWWLDGSTLALKAGVPPDSHSLGYCPSYVQVKRCHWLRPTLLRLFLETMSLPISTDPQRIRPWLGAGLWNSQHVDSPHRRKPLQHFNKPQSPELRECQEGKAC